LLGYETHGLATGDFDQDGDVDRRDALGRNLDRGEQSRGPADGDESDRNVITNSDPNPGAWTIVVTDYNHDGDSDLLVDGSNGYTLCLGGPA
jgi:hypothetical protein